MTLSREIVARVLPSNTSMTNFTDFRCSHDDLERIVEAAYKQGWNDREDDLLLGVKRLNARQEGARGGEPVEHAPDCQSHIVDVRGRPDECTCGADTSPAEPSGWPEKVREFIDNWFAPWGSWKTEWWEDVSRDREMTSANALLVLRGLLPPTSEGGGA